MLKKFIAYEFSLEVLLIFVAFVCLAVLLIKTVIPNFGVKSVVVSWFTMLTALIIFAYSIFFELKEESATSSFNTYACFTDDGRPIGSIMPPGCFSNCEILCHLDKYSRQFVTVLPADHVSDVGVELSLINMLSYLASDYRDWKSKVYSSPSSSLTTYRREEMAGKDRVVSLDAVLRDCEFDFFEFSLEKIESGRRYFLLPPLTDINVGCAMIIFRNPHFSFKVKVVPFNHNYRMEQSGQSNIWVAGYTIEINHHLPKTKAGHWKRSEYRKFCHSLSESLKVRFEVDADTYPVP